MAPLETFILVPQYNDWEALNLLIEKINTEIKPEFLATISLIIVDDCSPLSYDKITQFNGRKIQIVRLYRNLGHQRAIAIGLSYIAKELKCDRVIVMDADGEDAPKDINQLIEASNKNPNKIYFAQRTKRQEGILFRTFYKIYKFVFKQLTGSVISFGNFCIIPERLLQNVVRVSEIWNNFPCGVVKSKLPIDTIPIERAKRLAGESKMNFVSLITHGMSAISVLMETTSVRILILSIVSALTALIGISFLVIGRLLGFWSVSGWASSVSFVLIMIVLQAFLISLFLVFMVLQHRTNQQSIPISFYKDFIESIEQVPNQNC
jgi:polyisoprenyl-phosphate glycosyltransferase